MDWLDRWTNAEEDPMVSDSLWALSYITDMNSEGADKVVPRINLSRVVQCMLHENLLVKVPAIKIVSNVCCVGADFVAAALKAGALNVLMEILHKSKQQPLIAEVCEALLNAATHADEGQIEKLISSGCIQLLVSVTMTSSDPSVPSRSANPDRHNPPAGR